MCTLEARKHAFKDAWMVGIPTMILCWIIFLFLPAYQGTEAAGFMTLASASGFSCFVTPVICGLIAYPITKVMFVKKAKEKMANPDPDAAPAPEIGSLEEQIIFFNWMPKKWWVYMLVFSLLGCFIFGYGIPAFLAGFVSGNFVPAGIGAKLFVLLLGGIQVAASAQFCTYLTKFYFIQMLKADLPKLLAKDAAKAAAKAAK